jgi:hypothetical protein
VEAGIMYSLQVYAASLAALAASKNACLQAVVWILNGEV